MSLWFRVFGKNEAEPDLEMLLTAVRTTAPGLEAHFESSRGWRRAEFRLPESTTPLHLERFWRDEEGIRQELQTWAAWLETC